jgi:hypothetical protein
MPTKTKAPQAKADQKKRSVAPHDTSSRRTTRSRITDAPHDAESKSSDTTLKQQAAAPKPFYYGSQEVIADAVAEMVTTGSTEENLKLVIQAVIDHDWRRRFGQGVNEGRMVEVRGHSDYPERETRRILDELAVARTKRTKLENGERPEPVDVVGRIREKAREQCASDLEELLTSASPEEHRFISAVVLNYRSAHTGLEGYGDMGLASSFQEEINNREEYMRVPYSLLNDMQTYLDALIRAYPNGKPQEEEA